MQKKTTSKKLKAIICIECIVTLVMISSIVTLFIYGNTYIRTLYLILLCLMILCLLSGPLLVFLYYKELKKITNGSPEYYERKLPYIFINALLNGFCFLPGFFLFTKKINISFSTIISIFLSVFALIFTFYCFVLPLHKKEISKNNAGLNKLIRETKDSKELQTLQGEIYKNTKEIESLSISITISTIDFFLSVISCIAFGQIPFTYILLFGSIFFNIFYLFKLIYITHKIYSFDLDKLESDFANQTNNFEKKNKKSSKNKKV